MVKRCVVCSKELRGLQRFYCSDRCRKNAAQQRYRIRRSSGKVIPIIPSGGHNRLNRTDENPGMTRITVRIINQFMKEDGYSFEQAVREINRSYCIKGVRRWLKDNNYIIMKKGLKRVNKGLIKLNKAVI